MVVAKSRNHGSCVDPPAARLYGMCAVAITTVVPVDSVNLVLAVKTRIELLSRTSKMRGGVQLISPVLQQPTHAST